MKTSIIVRALLGASLEDATKLFENNPVTLGSIKNPDELVKMSLKPIAIGGGEFDVPNLNSGTDIYLPARIGDRYVRFSALAIGRNNGGVTYTVSVRDEGDKSTVKEIMMTSDFGAGHDAFIKTIKKELKS